MSRRISGNGVDAPAQLLDVPPWWPTKGLEGSR